jgi:hypothetical protein
MLVKSSNIKYQFQMKALFGIDDLMSDACAKFKID